MLHDPGLILESFGTTRQGRQRENQDAFLNKAATCLWAVADGVGGSGYGKAASHLIITMLSQLPSPQSLDAHLAGTVRALEGANQLCRLNERATGVSCASTVAVLLMHGGSAACLWAGDSRCYLLRDRVLYQCTHDHTLRQETIDRGKLTEQEALRMVKSNIITNAVGIKDELRLDETRFALRPGDRFLLCTDGFFNLLNPDRLSVHLAQPDARAAANAISAALDREEQQDDCTFTLIFLSSRSRV